MQNPIPRHVEVVGDWEEEPGDGGVYRLNLRCVTCGHPGFVRVALATSREDLSARMLMASQRGYAEQQVCPVCVHAARTGQEVPR